MDTKRIIGEVAARHGVRLDEDDPALVLVTISELMLREAREEFVESVRQATAEFVEAADQVQKRAGAEFARQVQDAVRQRSDQGSANATIVRMHVAASEEAATWARRRGGLLLLVSIVSFLCGVVAARYVL